MRLLIGGIEPCSLVDFPGRLAAVVFCHGCQLRCGYCHNPDLVTTACRRPIPVEALWSLLERRRGQLGGVVLSGGEPTLQVDLEACLARCGELGYARKLDTNGLRPRRLARLLAAGLVDYVALDLKDLPEAYVRLAPAGGDGAQLARRIRASIAALLTAGVDHEVRTTVCAPGHDRPRLRAMADELRGIRRWMLQPFRPGRTLDPLCASVAPDPALREQVVADAARIGLTAAWR